MKLTAKYRTSEFWYSDTEMLKKLRKQKFERKKRGITIFNNSIIEDCFPFDFIIKDLLVCPEATRRNNGYYPQFEEVNEE